MLQILSLRSIIEGFCDPVLLAAARNAPGDGVAVRPLVKHVADIVWNTLTKGQYKDRPHIQSIYSYLTGMQWRHHVGQEIPMSHVTTDSSFALT